MTMTCPIVRRLIDMPAAWRDRTLFSTERGRLTYGEMRERMLWVAGWLRAKGVVPGDRIAICLPKSLEALQAIFGILAAGAAYVPLQYQGPPARLRRILDSLEGRFLLTTEGMASILASTPDAARLPDIVACREDQEGSGLLQLLSGSAPASEIPDVEAEQLAAIFFTSGSTGEPKGVMWSHRGMWAATAAAVRRGGIADQDRLISLAGLHYSASAELFYPLHVGCGIRLVSEREALLARLVVETMERERTTIWSSSATALRLLQEEGALENADLSALRRIEMFGEPMSMPALRKAMAALPQTEFFNLYAASEAFDMAGYSVPRPIPEGMITLPLGRPSPTYELLLCEEGGGEAATGQPGEIVVLGAPVMLGYWKDPALTAAKRHAGLPDSYRTGDLAVRDADGLLQLVGRKDHVVKLRGHRFDLAEIEAVLKSHPRVRDAVAFQCADMTRPSDVRAVVLSDSGPRILRELQLICIARLPRFAVPAEIAVLEQFPMLSSGKADRRKLAEMTLPDTRRDEAHNP
jgi:amino acid adenylation domain-containing protein